MLDSVYLSLALYFIVLLGIGAYGYFSTKNDVSGFMLGGRQLGPAVTALSAGASDMSGWILMGLPGLIFLVGINGIWMAIGLTIGAYLNYRLLAPRLRVYTEQLDDAVTIPEYLERRFNDNSRIIRVLCAAVIIVFFAIYTTSGLVAGGKLFESSFGLSYETGIYLTALVVVSYSTFGGFTAVSVTDFVQGCIMLVALVLVPVVAVLEIGGVNTTITQLQNLQPSLLSFQDTALITVVSAMAWGLGYFGQPHIIVRFMAIRGLKDLVAARRIGMSWMLTVTLGTIGVGLTGAAFAAANGLTIADSETIFIVMSTTLFHPWVTGFLLAAILSAIMSTISSQLLVSSSSITEDVYYAFIRKKASQKERVIVARLSVVGVAFVALILAQDRSNSVLSLVGNAWAGFGAAFGPLILISLYWNKMTKNGAIAGIVCGGLTTILWSNMNVSLGFGLSTSDVYELIPGFLVSTLAILLVSMTEKHSERFEQCHHNVLKKLQN
ncbi:sodium/proline symporter PutP [Alteromonas marina]|uniref:sodium/proline symporter PutP n=1 Tax=Alteromonas sp. KUL150 TaxID=2480805 RepID=UPI0012E43FD7|nr:sodium/proline symporter PutP [Alteromonas sp. KUL150]GFD74375.1 osmoregulated proline transporter OpuE [Tenacibaculum sp. KUL113]GFD86987.1 osmoregulated proline transporter OpuE [Alteromonas sp. KUL150]